MTQEITFTKRIAKSGRGYLAWIPKDVTDFLKLNEKSTVEINIRNLVNDSQPLTFTKRAAKSGKGYLAWIPKDVTDFLKLNEKSTAEIKIRKLKGAKNE